MPGANACGRNSSNPVCYLSDTDIARASEPQHSVEGSRGDGDLGRLGLLSARAKGITDHALVAANRSLDFWPARCSRSPFAGPYGLAKGDHPQMAVALGRA